MNTVTITYDETALAELQRAMDKIARGMDYAQKPQWANIVRQARKSLTPAAPAEPDPPTLFVIRLCNKPGWHYSRFTIDGPHWCHKDDAPRIEGRAAAMIALDLMEQGFAVEMVAA